MDEVVSLELFQKWMALNEKKNALAFGYECLDRDKFAETVRESFQAIRGFKQRMLGEKFADCKKEIGTEKGIAPRDVINYANFMVELGKYSADVYMDESEEYVFTASQAVTRMLLDYAYYDCGVTPTDDNGVLCCWPEDLELYRSGDDDDCDYWHQTFTYDTNAGDMSAIIELAKRYNER